MPARKEFDPSHLSFLKISAFSPIMSKFPMFADLDDVGDASDHPLSNPELSDIEMDCSEDLPPPRKMARDRGPMVSAPERGT